MKKLSKTNQRLVKLIQELKILANKEKVKLWKRIATELEKSTRRKREVNIRRINRATKENETAIVPGKVLATGDLNHNVTVAAFQFSEAAKKKIKNTLTIEELMKKNPKAKGVRIIG